jgi:hypothetical protein
MGTPATTASRSKKHRRSYIVNPRFQWKYAFWLTLDVFVLCSVMGAVLLVFLEQHVRAGIVDPEGSWLAAPWLAVAVFSLGFAVVAAAAFGIWSVVITHRFCGPIFVIGKCLEEIIDRRWPERRTLRKRDEFKEFYELFWRAVETLRAQKREDLAALNGILNTVRSLSPQADQEYMGALKTAADEIQSLRDEVERELGGEHHERRPLAALDRGEPTA